MFLQLKLVVFVILKWHILTYKVVVFLKKIFVPFFGNLTYLSD